MASFYADEDFPDGVVEELRKLGHDVRTAQEAGNANQSIPDSEVVSFAHSLNRIVITLNRWDYIRLHGREAHSGIVVCTYDPDSAFLAARIHDAIQKLADLANQLVRVNLPP
jgi:hypothetical protein